MRCGAKCFLIQMEADGKKQVKSVIARTPAEARKSFRKEYGVKPQILSVRESKNDRLNNTQYK
ncbi:hypothetical protein [Ornithinibacillus bavariensis]|uniref:Uncharacterized protein n=1 Tax=Ornithinibacillus bavariensis TaxID=545502 RepID=A0A920C7C3_9BACI|nr:hypothetical protein [Ornithinibacillus bavariensis]GIO27523.1 hypothetical protein J43TS3_21340 [Ornithinibacillus bavariensis]HAM80208.1 hypothetical protein [Ornithinibacillus sp.]